MHCLCRRCTWSTWVPFPGCGLGRDYSPCHWALSLLKLESSTWVGQSGEIPMKDTEDPGGQPSINPNLGERILNFQLPTSSTHPLCLKKEEFTFYSSPYQIPPVTDLTLNHLILTHKALFGNSILVQSNFN